MINAIVFAATSEQVSLSDLNRPSAAPASHNLDGSLPVSWERSDAVNCLTMLDRIQAMEWAAVSVRPASARLVIHTRESEDPPEVGDYIGIYRADEPWLVWGVARIGDRITVWHGATASDVGSFKSMKDALASLKIRVSEKVLIHESAPKAVAFVEQFDDDSERDLTLELNSLEAAIVALAQKAQNMADESENRGKRIDALLAKVDEAMAALVTG